MRKRVPEPAVPVPVEVWGAPAQHPPQVAPGFARAWELGLLPPPPPAEPPAVVPGMSSWDRVRWGVALALGGLALAVLLWNATSPPPVVALLTAPVVWAPAAAGVALVLSTRRRDEVEFAAGYTSGQANTGLWRLARDGRVLREPDRTVPPPGWYPSPYWPGLLQRWDGPGWKPFTRRWDLHASRWLREPDVPFL